jgi:hypothetical protein
VLSRGLRRQHVRAAHREHRGARPGRAVSRLAHLRNRKVNEALAHGVETALAVITATPQGQAADAQFVKWLMDHQKEAGVFAVVSTLVDQVSDNPAARMTAQEIAQRAQQAQQQRTVGA